MPQLPPELNASFERRLDGAIVPTSRHPEYHQWAGLYLYFCRKFGYPPSAPTALGPFLTKLAAKSYSIEERRRASAAVRLLIRRDWQVGHADVKTSMIYLQTVPTLTLKQAKSPLDC
jgi:hypothetical protein